MKITSDTLLLIAGALLSLAFSYIPGLNTWYDGLDPQRKRLVMLAALVVVSLALFGISCAGWAADLGISVTCDQAGAVGLIRAFILALVSNQAIYPLTSRSKRSWMAG